MHILKSQRAVITAVPTVLFQKSEVNSEAVRLRILLRRQRALSIMV
jgi:hypothetical protein